MWEFIKAILYLGGFILVIVLTITSEAFCMFAGLVVIVLFILWIIVSVMKEITERF